MLSKFKKFSPLFLITLTVLSRFVGISWGDGFFFHPDENNMARSISDMKPDLNPHFFAYGQFPLYLSYFLINYLKLPQTFSVAVFSLRFFSAIFSCLTILVFHQLSLIFFKPKQAYLFILLLILSPGLIQISKFGTTESLLVLVFGTLIYLSLRFYQSKKLIYLFAASITLGIGIATKISSLIFITPVLLSLFFSQLKFKKTVLYLLFFLIFTLILTIIFSPYNLINWSDFKSASIYETGVALGTIKVFYTRQFENAPAYLFHFTKIFPYVSGLPVYILFFLTLLSKTPKQFKSKKIEFLIVFLSVLVYFTYFGSIYVKWTRFVSPIFFIFPFMTTFFLINIKNQFFKKALIFLSILPGFLFLSIYLQKDIRIQASDWINQNIESTATIFSEAGNVVNIPLNSTINTINFDFYNLDSSPDLQQQLPNHILNSDYILVPSRRMFKNQANSNFPSSYKYYQALANGSLGFSQIKLFSVFPYFFSHENAEETFTVFDHPVIRLYQKTTSHNLNYYQKLLSYD